MNPEDNYLKVKEGRSYQYIERQARPIHAAAESGELLDAEAFMRSISQSQRNASAAAQAQQ